MGRFGQWAAEDETGHEGTADAGALDVSFGSGLDDEQWPVLCFMFDEDEDSVDLDIHGLEDSSEEEDMSSLMSFFGPAKHLHKSAQQSVPEREKDIRSEGNPWSEGRAQATRPPLWEPPARRPRWTSRL